MSVNSSDLPTAAEDKTAVVLVTDPDFFLPTFVALNQLMAQVKRSPRTTAFVVMVGFTEQQRSIAAPMLSRQGARTEALHELPDLKGVTFHERHVPITTLGRFFICEVVPSAYANIVYLDGDIQINGDITPLLNHRVRDDFILAANDKYWLGDFGRKKAQEHYLSSLQVTADEYFNCGVLAFRRDTWLRESQRALRFFVDNSAICLAHDQSAINRIFRGRREILSPLYNFLTDYTLFGAADIEPPLLVHFTGGLKPWFYSGPPWERFAKIYARTLEDFPELKSFAVRHPEDVTRRMGYYHRKRQILYNTTVLVPMLRKSRYERYLRAAAFDVP